MKIAVLLGGDSPERDVSLDSGKNIIHALEQKGYDVFPFDPGLPLRDLTSQLSTSLSALEKEYFASAKDDYFTRIYFLKTLQPKLVFNALHGGKGENGVLQALFDTMNICYTGSGPEACMLSMDKLVSKPLFAGESIPVAQAFEIKSVEDFDGIADALGLPLIVKPADGGSTIGLSLVKGAKQLPAAYEAALQSKPNRVMAEKYIKGREIAAAVLDGIALPLVHIQPTHELYDYECKYKSGLSRYHVPAEMDHQLTELVQQYAVRAYDALGCSGYARIDFLVDENDIPYILEVNTLPGMTSTSLVPKAAAAAGIKFEDLIEKIVKDVLKNA